MKKENPALKYGIIGAVALVAVGVILQFIALSYLKKAAADPEKFSITGSIVVSLLTLCIVAGIMIFCIVRGMKEYRKQDLEYTYRKLVMQGLLVTLLMVLISSGISYIYNAFIMPETKEQTVQLTRIIYENMDIPEEQKQKLYERLDKSTPLRDILTGVGLSLIVGMIITLVSAMILNRKNVLYNPNQMR
jgi:hypothetical protein